jgi:hypothetical protein
MVYVLSGFEAQNEHSRDEGGEWEREVNKRLTEEGL